MIDVPVGELTFRARVDGPEDGELVLLLHGFPQSSHEWRHLLPPLGRAGFRAVAPDQRGYSPGARPQGVEHYARDHLVADVLAIADWLGGHTFHVVGHDWGAAIAWAVAGLYPDRVRTLTALSVPHPAAFGAALRGDDDQRRRSTYMDVYRAEGGVAEQTLLADDAAKLRATFTRSGLTDDIEPYVSLLREPGALTAALDWYRARQTGSVGPVTAPTVLVWGADDHAVGRAAIEACGEHVDGPFRLEVLEGVGHWIPEQAPDRLERIVLAHLAS